MPCVLYSGEIYNWKELCKELSDWGFPEPKDEADALLAAYPAWGPDFIKKVNGCFSVRWQMKRGEPAAAL